MPRRILLMRHAEKPASPTDPELSATGQARANKLATYIPDTFGEIEFLFASAPSKNSIRPIATITPLSDAIHVEIDEEFADQDYAALAHHLLTHPKYEGKTVLICWHHGHLPDLAAALGVNGPQVTTRWDPAVFNVVWQLDYTAQNPAPTVKVITEPF